MHRLGLAGHVARGDGGDDEAGPLCHRLQHRLGGDVDVLLPLHRQVVTYPLFQDKVQQEILANCQIDFYHRRPRQ